MAKISVVVPVYNVEEYVSKCIESILNQSFTNFKLILVNDGSTDKSASICDFYKSKDPRISVIHQENKGLSMARNKGIELSKEKYITFIDSDDYVHKDMLKILYNNLIANKADISVCNYKIVGDGEEVKDNKQVNKVKLLTNIKAVREIVVKSNANMIIACGKLYKRNLFQGIRYPRGKYHEDEFVTYKLLYNSKRVVTTNAKMYYYTKRDESITQEKYTYKRLEKLEGLKEAISFFREKQEKDLELKARIRYLLNIQIGYYKVKYEINSRAPKLKELKSIYDDNYKVLLEGKEKIGIVNNIKIKLFYRFPDVYCKIINKIVKDLIAYV